MAKLTVSGGRRGHCATVTVEAGGEVLAAKLLSPEYIAVIAELLPPGKITLSSVATPPLSVAEPSVVVPFKNVTVPVGTVVSLESADMTLAMSEIGAP